MADEDAKGAEAEGEGVASGSRSGSIAEADKPRVKLVLEDGDVKLNERQEGRARDMFAKYDKDGSDNIDKEELRELLKELNLRLSEDLYDKYVDRYWKEADEDVSGRINMQEFLVLYAKVFAPNNMYGSALRTASARGHADVVRDLCARGCNPNTGDGKGWTALHHAAEFGRLDVIKVLQEVMEMDLDVDPDDNYGWTPLFNAATNNYVDVMRHLLRSGAHINEVSTRGRSALHASASAGHTDAVRCLLNEGADVTLTDEGGWTALHCAVLHGHAAVIRLLVEGGADLTAKDNCSYTVHRYADDASTKKLLATLEAEQKEGAAGASGKGTKK